ncbi:OmpA family protein [Fulvivirga sedimenti]|uniref:OmpA family protein n=1 Tax=Fulvivirga sedimenti TaxID=2879465 RepID=A0A9X1HTC7_9BACT|nr:OmpA family protein [Fulvivirga sedimenti]MCA6077908.1 OmpA family protein [Fulvivirga sedimenti]
MLRVIFLAGLICSFIFTELEAQIQYNLSTKSKKAAEYFAEADNFRVRGQYDEAISWLQKAIDKDKEFYEAYLQLGLILKALGKLAEAQSVLEKMADLPHPNHAPTYFELADLYIQLGDYESARTNAQSFLDLNPRNSKRASEAQQIIDNANFALENASKAAAYNPVPLPAEVNAFPMQYFPVVTVDGNAIIYTRRNGMTMDYDEDLVISRKDQNGKWQMPESLSPNINSAFNEGTCTISADGRRLIFTSCLGRKGYGSCDLFITERQGDEWSEPRNLGDRVNGPEWDSQPTLSPDGRTLYFVSTRKGGIGGRDIWMTTLNEAGEWTKAVNLGAAVNTAEEDVSPFIHPNNRTLYFASNGRTGFGGYDIYFTERTGDGWSEPQNFGAPVNTGEDQVSLFISANGEKGYYSLEDQSNPSVKSSIYEFDVPSDMRVTSRASYVFGVVTDAETGEVIEADIELFDLASEERVGLVSSDPVSGEYLIVLAEGSDYALYVNETGYLFTSLSFAYDRQTQLEPIRQDITLTPIKEGSRTVLNNIFFETDKYALQERSQTELNKVIRFMNTNPELRIEVSGHTDDVGADDYNLSLSNRRAKSVYDYLTQNGVEPERIRYAGYGEQRPAFPNDSDENRSKNRRIEFEIIN